jgi:catechol 2,3-dioxygenase-like lactoylglutathione lyase family enzyme
MDAPPLRGLSHFQFNVSDLDASVAWYTTALGVRVLRGEPGRYVTLQSELGHFRVVLAAGGQAGSGGALDHIAFAVSDLDALVAWSEHLAGLGIDHEGVVPNIVGGHSLDLFDPDGNNIELVYEA